MNFEIKKFAFLYGDYEYFQWFSNKTKENLEKVIKWKRLRRGKPNTNRIWDAKRKDLIDKNILENSKFGVVTRAFLLHLKLPTQYPIFDSNVFKAMFKIKNNKDKKTITSMKDYDKYKEFFNKYYEEHKEEIANLNIPDLSNIPKEIIERKFLDRALWEFGRLDAARFNFLKNSNVPNFVKVGRVKSG